MHRRYLWFSHRHVFLKCWIIPGTPDQVLALGFHWFDSGLQIFFKIGGPKWPMEQKMVGHFLKWWAQAYQTNHSWHLGSLLYLNTDTDTCMRPLKKEDQLSLNEGQKYCRMLQGEHSAMLLTFNKLPFVIKIFLFVFFEWLFYCIDYLLCGVSMIFLLK